MELKPGYKMTEVGVIPEDWEVICIKNLAEIKTGNKNTQDSITGGKYPFFVRSQTVERINTYSFNGEAVLTAGDGVGTGKIFHYINGKFDYHQRVYKISNFSNKLNGYFFYLYFSSFFYNRIMQMTAKSSVDSVRMEMIADMPIALPPIPEQQAIAAALSDVDELLSSLDRLIAKKKDIRLATMQELLTGKKRLPGFNSNTTYQKTDLGTFPSDWKILPIHNFTECTSGGTPNTKIHSYWGGKHPWMSSGELHMKYIYNVSKRITDEGLMNSSTKYIPKNSVLIGLAGQGKTRGTVALAKISLCINQSIAAIFPSNICNSEYLFYNLNSRYTELREISSGDGGRGGLNLNLVNNIYIPLPSYLEQQAIASVLSDMDAEIEALEARRDKVRNIKRGMMQELLTGKTRLISAGEPA